MNEISLAIDPYHSGAVYAGGQGTGVCRTEDGGDNWTGFNEGLAAFSINSLVVGGSDPWTLYAGTSSSGVASYSDVPCTLSCGATVPAAAIRGAEVTFACVSTPRACPGSPAYDWDFGDGSSHASTQDASHVYAASGSFTWQLTVSDGDATCTKTGTITVNSPCTLTCTDSVADTVPAGTAATFSSTATPDGCSGAPTFEWDFGDGSPHGSTSECAHSYTKEGTYGWALTTSIEDVTCTKTGNITVVPPCTLSCTASVPTQGQVGADLAFSSTATPSNCSGQPLYDWDFGDGSPDSQAQNSSHAYTSAGLFTWRLTLTVDAVPCVKTGSITVTPPCSLSCTADVPASGQAGVAAAFTSTANPSNCSGSAVSDWDFGDGSTHAATPAATHVYASPGDYQWVLNESIEGATCTRTGTISVAPPCALACTAVVPASGRAGSTVSFTATATASHCTGSPAFDWDFGDGSDHVSTPDASHAYGAAGTYSWTLTASIGTLTCTRTGAITITPPCTLSCTASVSPSGRAGTDIAFTSTATASDCLGAPSFEWDFGDGSAHVSSSSAVHAYSNSGSYTWSLQVSVDGISCSKTGVIAVAPPCTLACEASVPSIGQVGASVACSATATPSNCLGIPSFDWDFGDGSAHASSPDTGHVYLAAGSFTWTLAVSVDGMTCSKAGTIAVAPPCSVGCNASAPATATSGLPVTFSGDASASNCLGSVALDWNFGDGTAHGAAPGMSHTFASPGTYAWTFSATAQGVTCLKTGAITVVAPPSIISLKKISPPFKIVVEGSNLQQGIRVFIDGSEWTGVAYRSTTKIQLTGSSLKRLLPKGTTHAFRFLNPDGGQALLSWSW